MAYFSPRVSSETQSVSKSSRNSLSHYTCAEVVWFFFKAKRALIQFVLSVLSVHSVILHVLLSWALSAFVKVSLGFLTTFPLGTQN